MAFKPLKPTDKLLKFKNLHTSFKSAGKYHDAVDDVNLSFNKEEKIREILIICGKQS